MKVPFYKRKEFWGTVITLGSIMADISVLGLLPQHTVAYKIGIGIGITLTAFGVRRGYKDQNLPGQINGPEGLRRK
jgi:hypothetical protein